MVTTIDPSETYPLYLRCVEHARGVANSSNASGLSYKEAFNAALIAFAFALGKDSVRQTVREYTVPPVGAGRFENFSDASRIETLRRAVNADRRQWQDRRVAVAELSRFRKALEVIAFPENRPDGVDIDTAKFAKHILEGGSLTEIPLKTPTPVAEPSRLLEALQMIASADDSTYMSSVKEFAKHVLEGGSLADIPAKAIF